MGVTIQIAIGIAVSLVTLTLMILGLIGVCLITYAYLVRKPIWKAIKELDL